MTQPWLPEDEQRFYDGVVHGLRMKGWSRMEAEGEALNRLVGLRDSQAKEGELRWSARKPN
jgi:hypothetical protein